MNLYLDSSVVLRAVLGERGLLPQWRQVKRAVSSELLRLECLRTIDRARLRVQLPDREVASIRASLLDLLSSFDLLPLDPAIRIPGEKFGCPRPARKDVHLDVDVKDGDLGQRQVDLVAAARVEEVVLTRRTRLRYQSAGTQSREDFRRPTLR